MTTHSSLEHIWESLHSSSPWQENEQSTSHPSRPPRSRRRIPPRLRFARCRTPPRQRRRRRHLPGRPVHETSSTPRQQGEHRPPAIGPSAAPGRSLSQGGPSIPARASTPREIRDSVAGRQGAWKPSVVPGLLARRTRPVQIQDPTRSSTMSRPVSFGICGRRLRTAPAVRRGALGSRVEAVPGEVHAATRSLSPPFRAPPMWVFFLPVLPRTTHAPRTAPANNVATASGKPERNGAGPGAATRAATAS